MTTIHETIKGTIDTRRDAAMEARRAARKANDTLAELAAHAECKQLDVAAELSAAIQRVTEILMREQLRLSEYLAEGKSLQFCVNSLGILQDKGSDIDRLCGMLCQAAENRNELVGRIEFDAELAAEAKK